MFGRVYFDLYFLSYSAIDLVVQNVGFSENVLNH